MENSLSYLIAICETIVLLSFFIFMPYMGISLIGTGEYGPALIIFAIPICLLAYKIYFERVIVQREERKMGIIIVPREKRKISIMYNIIQKVKSGECRWDKSVLLIIEEICKTIIYLCFFVLLLYTAISLIGIGEYTFALIILSFPLCLLAYNIYLERVVIPREEQMIALSHKYNIPLKAESGSARWGNVFQQIIDAAIKNVTEIDKKNDLQQSRRIVKKMANEKSFDDLHRSFRLTGCHMKITDGCGKIITKIV